MEEPWSWVLRYFGIYIPPLHPFGILSSHLSYWNIFTFSILLEYFSLFHYLGMYSHFPSFWNIFIFSILLEYFSTFHLKWVFGTLLLHFVPLSQGEGLCAQQKLQPLIPPNCLLEGTGPKSSGLAYLFTIFLFVYYLFIVYKPFNSYYFLWRSHGLWTHLFFTN